MLTELVTKRSKLIADRKALVGAAEREGRLLNGAEKEAVKKNEAECEDIAETVRASNRLAKDQKESLEYAIRLAAGRFDTDRYREADLLAYVAKHTVSAT